MDIIMSRMFRFFLIFLLSYTSFSCGGGGGGSQTFEQLTNLPIMYSDVPIQNQETSISLITDSNVGEITWSVVSEPIDSSLVLSKSTDNKTITFTASEPGEYQINAHSVSNDTEKLTTFTISPAFAFDESKIEGNDGIIDIEKITGIIVNQSWVNSFTLSKSDLELIIANYPNLQIIGYDEILGLLVEYDENDISIIEALEEIKGMMGISGVRNRYYIGNRSMVNSIVPNDGSLFDDTSGRDNWHLQRIGMSEAWEYTTGSSTIVVGISEGAYDTPDYHDELLGRFNSILPGEGGTDRSESLRAHGNATAGAVGAVTDNTYGMSGINWNSPLHLGLWNFSGLLIMQHYVSLTNSSWQFPLPYDYESGTDKIIDFDPNNEAEYNLNRKYSIDELQKFRILSEVYSDKLFVWAAGNGIGLGVGNVDGIYGVDAVLGNGAIHYSTANDRLGSLSRLNNSVVVAAMRNDSRLANYSNYGISVDIAAPTSYKSLSSNEGFKVGDNYGDGLSGYGGTSAAAPVVTGVASLIYSIYPGFTGEEVKNILISTATEFVTHRYIALGDAGTNNSNIELLDHPIPILNAARALEKAQEIIDSKIRLVYSIPDPFTPLARIEFKSIDQDFEVIGLEWNLQSANSDGEKWSFVSSLTVDSNIAEPMLDTGILDYRLVTNVTLRNKNDTAVEVTSNSTYEFGYSNISVSAGENFNTIQEAFFAGVTFEVENLLDSSFTQTSVTGDDGAASVYLKSGVYKLRGNLEGYDEVVKLLVVDDPQFQQIDFNMTSTKIEGLLQIMHPDSAFTQVGLLDAPNTFSGNLLCLSNNGTNIALPNNPEEVCDSFDTPNTSDLLLHECQSIPPWIKLDPADVSCSVEGNLSTYVSLGSVEYTGDISSSLHYLKNSISGVTRISDSPDTINGKTLCWAVAKTPVVFQDQVDDVQFPAIKWAEVDYSGIDDWVGKCKKDLKGYVGIDTVISN